MLHSNQYTHIQHTHNIKHFDSYSFIPCFSVHFNIKKNMYYDHFYFFVHFSSTSYYYNFCRDLELKSTNTTKQNKKNIYVYIYSNFINTKRMK